MKITKKLPRDATAKFAVGLIAVFLVIGFLQHGKLKIGDWLYIDVPATSGGKGGDAIAEAGGKALGGAAGLAGAIGPGGAGGDARASGAGSFAMGGPGGHGGLALADPAEAFKLVRVSPQPVGKAVKPGNPTDAVGVAAEAERR
jgi:hypothetical protein